MFEAHCRIGFPFCWRDSYVGWELAGCELTHSHAMTHLRLIRANCAYQVIVVRYHLFNIVGANPPNLHKRNFTPLMICFQLYYIYIMCFSELWSVGFSVAISFVFDVSLHSISADISVDHLLLIKIVLGSLRSGIGCLLWANSHLKIQDIKTNTPWKTLLGSQPIMW